MLYSDYSCFCVYKNVLFMIMSITRNVSGAWWLIGKFGALRLEGRRLHSSRHVGTLGKSFTYSCIYCFGVYQCCSRECLWVVVDLKRCYIWNEWWPPVVIVCYCITVLCNILMKLINKCYVCLGNLFLTLSLFSRWTCIPSWPVDGFFCFSKTCVSTMSTCWL